MRTNNRCGAYGIKARREGGGGGGGLGSDLGHYLLSNPSTTHIQHQEESRDLKVDYHKPFHAAVEPRLVAEGVW